MTDAPHAERIIFHRSLVLGVKTALPMLFVMALTPPVVYSFAKGHGDPAFLTGWLIAAVFVLAIRATYALYFTRHAISDQNAHVLHSALVFAAFANGLLWGIGSIGLVDNMQSTQYYLVLFIIMAYTIGSPNTLFMLPYALSALLIGLWIPTVGRLIAHQDSVNLTLAIVLSLLTLMSLFSSLKRRREYVNLISLQIENEVLITRLRRERDDSKKLNRQLNAEISRRKATEEDLHTSQQRLLESKAVAESANGAKNDFLSSMSHELRTPLNAIIGYSDIMRRRIFGPLNIAKYKDYPHLIHEAGTHLLDLVDNLLTITKLERQSEKNQVSLICPYMLIDAVTNLSSTQTNSKQLKIEKDLHTDLPSFQGNSFRLEQVLYNFMKNAITFSSTGSTVTIGSFIDGFGDLVFYVNDEGSGMGQNQIETAFSLFEKGDHTELGMGIGLNIARQIIAKHEGEIRLHSDLGNGTTIAFTIPRSRHQQPPE